MQVTDGWEPLCEFLGISPPDEPFPHENDRESFGARNVAN
jgi:sulfotransferase family protein